MVSFSKGLSFSFVASENDLMEKGQGCWSYIGRIGGEQMISIGPNCLREGVIIHEILHALGFFHEHSRPDRDQYITIDFDNLKDGMQHNFETLNLRNWFNMSIPYGMGFKNIIIDFDTILIRQRCLLRYKSIMVLNPTYFVLIQIKRLFVLGVYQYSLY